MTEKGREDRPFLLPFGGPFSRPCTGQGMKNGQRPGEALAEVPLVFS